MSYPKTTRFIARPKVPGQYEGFQLSEDQDDALVMEFLGAADHKPPPERVCDYEGWGRVVRFAGPQGKWPGVRAYLDIDLHAYGVWVLIDDAGRVHVADDERVRERLVVIVSPIGKVLAR